MSFCGVASFDMPTRNGVNFGGLFNPHDAKYRCCFRCCHLRLGVVLICAMEFFASIVAVSMCVESYASSNFQSLSDTSNSNGPDSPTLLAYILENETVLLMIVVASVAMAFAIFVSVTFTLWGVSKQKRAFLLPHMVVQSTNALAILALIGLFSWTVASAERTQMDKNLYTIRRHGDDEKGREFNMGVLVLSLIAESIAFVLQLYFLRVTYNCYRYLKRQAVYDQVAHFARVYGMG